jgi:hypothetical protein
MAAKEEIERRLKKGDYSRISKKLFDKSFDDLLNDEYIKLSIISDLYGSKYKKIYKLKNSSDINTILSNLTNKTYSPNFTTHNDLKIIYTVKRDKGFIIYLEFYTLDVVYKDVDYSGVIHRVPHNEHHRRIMTIDKQNDNDFVIISIDPIGEGPKVYTEINSNIEKLSRIINLDFQIFLDNISLKKVLFKLIEDEKLIPKNLNAIDETTKRSKSVSTGTSKDNIKDDDLYKECISDKLKAENIKMKYNKESLELFGDTLIKFSTSINGEKTDEFTKQITSFL